MEKEINPEDTVKINKAIILVLPTNSVVIIITFVSLIIFRPISEANAFGAFTIVIIGFLTDG